MRTVGLLRIILLSALFLGSCGKSNASMTFYAVFSPTNVSRFTQDLASLATKHGLIPQIGQATDDRGHTLHIVEAKGRSIRLWSQNLPLSGRENPDLCGNHIEAHPDPGQFIVTITTQVPFVNKDSAAELAVELQHELSELGYEIQQSPVACSWKQSGALR